MGDPASRRSLDLRGVLLAGAVLGVACGNGGGGGGAPRATITVENAHAVASSIARGIELTLILPAEVDGALPPDPGAAGAGAQIPGREVPATASRAAFGPSLRPCGGEGVVELSGDVADPGTYSQGDVVAGDYETCSFNGFDYFDGRMEVGVTSLVGDLSVDGHQATLDASFDAFDVGFHTVSGRATVDIDTAPGARFQFYGLRGGSLQVESDSGETHEIANFALDVEVDTMPPIASRDRFAFSTSGEMTSSGLDGWVSYSTPEELTSGLFQVVFDRLIHFPTFGELLIVGRGGASIRIDPCCRPDFDLEIDLDGDGSIDALVETDWTTLLVEDF